VQVEPIGIRRYVNSALSKWVFGISRNDDTAELT